MDLKKCILFSIIVYLQLATNAALRPLESLRKPFEPIQTSKSIHIVNYVLKNEDGYKIEEIGVKHLNINYNPVGKQWLAKATWTDNYNTTGYCVLMNYLD